MVTVVFLEKKSSYCHEYSFT